MSVLPCVTEPTRERSPANSTSWGPLSAWLTSGRILIDTTQNFWTWRSNGRTKVRTARGSLRRSECFIEYGRRRPLLRSNLAPLARCLEFPPRHAARSSRASIGSGTRNSAASRSPILKPQIPNSFKWRITSRRSGRITPTQCKALHCFMRRSWPSGRATVARRTDSVAPALAREKSTTLTIIRALQLSGVYQSLSAHATPTVGADRCIDDGRIR
jgi:hypothetical protein